MQNQITRTPGTVQMAVHAIAAQALCFLVTDETHIEKLSDVALHFEANYNPPEFTSEQITQHLIDKFKSALEVAVNTATGVSNLSDEQAVDVLAVMAMTRGNNSTILQKIELLGIGQGLKTAFAPSPMTPDQMAAYIHSVYIK